MDADARTDLFAFGCVLFEMLTGRKAFEGKTRASLLGAILKDEPPPISKVQPIAPASLDRIVATCLAKDPDDRWQTARDLKRELKWVGRRIRTSDDVRRTPRHRGARPAAQRAAARRRGDRVGGDRRRRGLDADAPGAGCTSAVHLQAPPNPDVSLWIDNIAPDVALSPDGTHLAYTGGTGQSQLYVRSLSQDDSVPLAGTFNVRGPFFSPDGEWIGYFQLADLKKVSVRGGPPVTICATCAAGNRGAAGPSDDTIIFAAAGGSSGLLRVPAGGGQPVAIAKPDTQNGERGTRGRTSCPAIGRCSSRVLSNGAVDDGLIAVRDLQTGTQKTLVRGGTFPAVRARRVPRLRRGRNAPRDSIRSRDAHGLRKSAAGSGSRGQQGHGAVDVSVSSDGAMVYITGVQSAWTSRRSIVRDTKSG